MSGFVAIHRMMLEHPLFIGHSSRAGAWIWLLMRACWKPTPFDISGKIITLERGQLCASRSQMAKAWGWSPSAVERFLTRLKTEQMIEQATGQGRSIITICNYSKYQSISEETGQATGQATGQRSDRHRTAKEQGNKVTSNIKKNTKRKLPVKIARPDGIDAQTWSDFQDHRKSKNAPITETVIKGFEREAVKCGWTLQKAITESIERGWRGFKADWINNERKGADNENGNNRGNNGLLDACRE